MYSILNIDVSLHNMLMHTAYSFAGMQPFLDRVFVLFGVWHCYMYAHVALWDRFRLTFLADAFFALFPNTILMRKPSLFKSSVFLTWLRIAYADFRDDLLATVEELKQRYLREDQRASRNTKKHALTKAISCS